MRDPPRRTDNWWISPAIPAIANGVLAMLWGFSTFGGWGAAAFCGRRDHGVDAQCAARMDDAVTVSAVPAALAAAIALTGWATPRIRRNADRFDGLLTASALVWVVAEVVFFVGGLIAQR